jgi:CRP-like cAMP-binding protein
VFALERPSRSIQMSNSDVLRAFLHKLMARTILTEAEQAVILSLPGTPQQLSAREDFVERDDGQSSACLVANGLCARVVHTLGGGRQITGFYVAGDLPNPHSIMVPNASTALQAICPTQTLRIPHSELRKVALTHPGIGEALWRDAVCAVDISVEWIANLGARRAKIRLAHLLCEMAVRYGIAAEGSFEYEFPVTQEALGAATGLTSVHVNRSLKALREEGSVVIRGKQVQVPDWKKLQECAEFDSAYLQMQEPMRFSPM